MRLKLALAVTVIALCSAVAFAADAPSKMTPEQQAAMDKMMKATMPGPQHAMLAKMAGDWNRTVKLQMDPSKPAEEAQGTSSIVTLLDGRFIQETVLGNWGGVPYNGMALYGFDNVTGKYVATMIDNQGTGFMSCVGTADSSGKVIQWVATMNDPASGKARTEHMRTTVTDDDHHTFEMFNVSPGTQKETKILTIDYVRKK